MWLANNPDYRSHQENRTIQINMGKTKLGDITATCTYPPYCIKWIGEKHFLVGGGGGASKTGVPNKFVRNMKICCIHPI